MDGLECSEIKKSELEFSGRTDAEYYQKKFLQYQNIIEAHNILPLSKVADFLIGPFGSAIDSEVALKQGGLSSLITLALSMSMKWKALI